MSHTGSCSGYESFACLLPVSLGEKVSDHTGRRQVALSTSASQSIKTDGVAYFSRLWLQTTPHRDHPPPAGDYHESCSHFQNRCTNPYSTGHHALAIWQQDSRCWIYDLATWRWLLHQKQHHTCMGTTLWHPVNACSSK